MQHWYTQNRIGFSFVCKELKCEIFHIFKKLYPRRRCIPDDADSSCDELPRHPNRKIVALNPFRHVRHVCNLYHSLRNLLDSVGRSAGLLASANLTLTRHPHRSETVDAAWAACGPAGPGGGLAGGGALGPQLPVANKFCAKRRHVNNQSETYCFSKSCSLSCIWISGQILIYT